MISLSNKYRSVIVSLFFNRILSWSPLTLFATEYCHHKKMPVLIDVKKEFSRAYIKATLMECRDLFIHSYIGWYSIDSTLYLGQTFDVQTIACSKVMKLEKNTFKSWPSHINRMYGFRSHVFAWANSSRYLSILFKYISFFSSGEESFDGFRVRSSWKSRVRVRSSCQYQSVSKYQSSQHEYAWSVL